MPLQIRPAQTSDLAAIWRILEPVIRVGETYTLPQDMSEADALAYWLSPAHEVFVDAGSGPGLYPLSKIVKAMKSPVQAELGRAL
jgi:hypothetical protein